MHIIDDQGINPLYNICHCKTTSIRKTIMTTEEHNDIFQAGIQDQYCVVRDKEHNFCWVINLEDHPSSFLADRSYRKIFSKGVDGTEDSVVLISSPI
jgi:hypothetical protein